MIDRDDTQAFTRAGIFLSLSAMVPLSPSSSPSPSQKFFPPFYLSRMRHFNGLNAELDASTFRFIHDGKLEMVWNTNKYQPLLTTSHCFLFLHFPRSKPRFAHELINIESCLKCVLTIPFGKILAFQMVFKCFCSICFICTNTVEHMHCLRYDKCCWNFYEANCFNWMS